MIVDVGFEINHTGNLRFGNDDVIQRGIGTDDAFSPHQFTIKHAPAANAMFALQRSLQLRIQLFDGDGRQKSERTQIDGEQGDIPAANRTRRRC